MLIFLNSSTGSMAPFDNIADKIIEVAEKGDIVITMGGGDIYKAAHIVQEKLG